MLLCNNFNATQSPSLGGHGWLSLPLPDLPPMSFIWMVFPALTAYFIIQMAVHGFGKNNTDVNRTSWRQAGFQAIKAHTLLCH